MKRGIFIFLLVFPVSVNAEMYTYDFVHADISKEDYPNVVCEREKPLYLVRAYDYRLCCVNKPKQKPYCEMNEDLLGICFEHECIWPTDTFILSYSFMFTSSGERVPTVKAGEEYASLLTWAECERKKPNLWTCPLDAFPVPEKQETIVPVWRPKPPSPTGALLIVDDSDWKAIDYGYRTNDQYLLRAYNFEKQRCATGGGEIYITDAKYGSFFKDTGNFRKGMRAFYMYPSTVVPLISWC